jgi:hypothetical protein
MLAIAAMVQLQIEINNLPGKIGAAQWPSRMHTAIANINCPLMPAYQTAGKPVNGCPLRARIN